MNKNSAAIGVGAIADRDDAISFGFDGIDGDNDLRTNPAFQRQLINVAAATEGTDAVNLDQLRAEIANVDANPFFVTQSTDDGTNLPSAAGTDAVAIGARAVADVDNSIALGADFVAAEKDTVSIGSDRLKRKLVNLDAGTADTDAVIPLLRRRISPVSFRTSTRRLKVWGKGRGRPMAGLRRPWR